MKTNRRYIAALILTQMILVPIALTLVFFVLAEVLAQFMGKASAYWPGDNAAKLIYILIAFFGALILGGAAGYIFSKSRKNKPDSAKARYIAPGLSILYALPFAVAAAILSKGDYNSVWWGLYVFKNPVFVPMDFVLAFTGLHFIMPVAEISGYSGFAAGILLQERIAKTSVGNKTAVKLKVLLAALFGAFIIFTCISAGNEITNGIIELRYGQSTIGKDLTEFDLMQIAPFKAGNGLAKLKGEASLQFTALNEMPRLDGATAAYPVYAAFVQAVYKGLGDYYEANKNNNEKDMYTAFVSSDSYPLDIVKCTKTTEAYERLINGQTDIIFVAEPSAAQVDAIKAKGDEFVLTPIGSEAFVFFTNKNNPVENLALKQIQDIYSGKITNWKVLGGKNAKILPYQRPENSGSQTVMENRVMKGIKMLEPTKETKAGGMGEIISRVADYKNAKNSLGYSFMYYATSMIKNNQIKYISVNGIKPSPETVRSKEYPFTVPVYAVTLKSNDNKFTGKFIDWILSPEGQSLIEQTGYVPAGTH